jgi:predicted HTH domain antitoxin
MMQSIAVTLERPISQFVERHSQEQNVSYEQAIQELIAKGFEALLQERYQRYRQGEISFGRLAQDLGVTTWELSHLLEERGWAAYNLPSAT